MLLESQLNLTKIVDFWSIASFWPSINFYYSVSRKILTQIVFQSREIHRLLYIYRVVQNYWYCEGKYGCGVCLTPPKSYMSFFFHKNNIFQHFTSRKFPKYCAKFWKIMSVNWIILHPYFRNDNFSKDRIYSFLIEILFTKLS